MSYAIAIHGGAGTILRTFMTPEREAAYTAALVGSIRIAEKILAQGGSSLDAVQAAVKNMEDEPLFNAGRGSVFTANGKNEMDAAIMSGKDLRAGAVTGISNIRNPVALARAVMERSDHVLLSGSGALEFAKMTGAEFAGDDYFFTEERFAQLETARKSGATILDHTPDDAHPQKPGDHKFGTVGAVALDQHGNLAAATSTGGMTNKKYGRVGDSPVIGAGTYANNRTCAISCTGHGEFFLRSVVAYDVSCLMEYRGLSLHEACEEVVMRKLVDIGGEGGLVAVDAKGNIAMPFNTSGMYRAMKTAGGQLFVGIYK